jgi:hypothetical protein
VWSAALASRAQEHANKCRFEHTPDLLNNRVGENIVRRCRSAICTAVPPPPPALTS